ncbi:MAG: hypothetical protein LBH06_05200 [Rikenellaceae bacterium]|jgi:hypothetical protein|nr:hypothetical protein [Rikenellaceae bacterium]
MKRYAAIALLLLITAPVPAQKTSQRDRSVSDYYFPKNSFSTDNDSDAFRQIWYGKHLDVLDREKLTVHQNAIRFTYLRTFHGPFSIKTTWNGSEKTVLTFSMSNGAGGYGAGILTTRFRRKLTAAQLGELIGLTKKYDIFDQPSTIEEPVCDGSQWIIEINIDGKYKRRIAAQYIISVNI